MDLIIGDGGLSTGMEPLLLQKLDLAQLIMVLACSKVGGCCVIKHFTPYIKRHLDTFNASYFFVGLNTSPQTVGQIAPATLAGAGAVQIFTIIYMYTSLLKIPNRIFSILL